MLRIVRAVLSLSLLGMSLAPVAADAGDTPQDRTRSIVEIIDIQTGKREEIFRTERLVEAPNWSRDGKSLIINSEGKLYRLPVGGGALTEIFTGSAQANNNDHGLSPDGTLLAISDQTGGKSRVMVVPADGGEPRLVTKQLPSYWHGWSPDGRTLAYVGERGGNFDIYTIPVEGGEERRLTTDPAPEDGPDYAPDGTIYFNSARSGRMQIWHMQADGSGQRRVTHDDRFADWFPHPSPDGRWLVFLSYDGSVEGHPADKDVVLRIMPLDGSAPPRILTRLFGGQGTINVPSWSPDGRRLAFVSYRPLQTDAKPDR